MQEGRSGAWKQAINGGKQSQLAASGSASAALSQLPHRRLTQPQAIDNKQSLLEHHTISGSRRSCDPPAAFVDAGLEAVGENRILFVLQPQHARCRLALQRIACRCVG